MNSTKVVHMNSTKVGVVHTNSTKVVHTNSVHGKEVTHSGVYRYYFIGVVGSSSDSWKARTKSSYS